MNATEPAALQILERAGGVVGTTRMRLCSAQARVPMMTVLVPGSVPPAVTSGSRR